MQTRSQMLKAWMLCHFKSRNIDIIKTTTTEKWKRGCWRFIKDSMPLSNQLNTVVEIGFSDCSHFKWYTVCKCVCVCESMEKSHFFHSVLLAAVSFLQLYFYDNFIFMNWKCLGRTCFSHSIAHELFLLRSLSHALMLVLCLTFFRSFYFRISFLPSLDFCRSRSLFLSLQIRIYHMSGIVSIIIVRAQCTCHVIIIL